MCFASPYIGKTMELYCFEMKPIISSEVRNVGLRGYRFRLEHSAAAGNSRGLII
jgi:hypothetical protein